MRALIVSLAALATITLASGCGSGGPPDEHQQMLDLVESGDWEEILAQAELLRGEGETSAPLDYAEGLALLHQNADKMAVKLLERAVAQDSSLAAGAASDLAELARTDQEEGWEARATRRMAQAYVFDSTVELGALKDPVADYFYRYVEDYERAYPIYYELYQDRPGRPKKVREWVYRYGACLERLGSIDAALAVYEEYQGTWPQDREFGRLVNWRYMHLLLDLADEAHELGQHDRALRLLERSMVDDWHMDVQQQARYRAGVIEQERGRLDEARRWYEMVLEDGSRFGGETVGQARARLEELREMGVH